MTVQHAALGMTWKYLLGNLYTSILHHLRGYNAGDVGGRDQPARTIPVARERVLEVCVGEDGVDQRHEQSAWLSLVDTKLPESLHRFLSVTAKLGQKHLVARNGQRTGSVTVEAMRTPSARHSQADISSYLPIVGGLSDFASLHEAGQVFGQDGSLSGNRCGRLARW